MASPISNSIIFKYLGWVPIQASSGAHEWSPSRRKRLLKPRQPAGGGPQSQALLSPAEPCAAGAAPARRPEAGAPASRFRFPAAGCLGAGGLNPIFLFSSRIPSRIPHYI